MPYELSEVDANRLTLLLNDYEQGRLTATQPFEQQPGRAPIEHYVGLVTVAFAASTGEPTLGHVAIYGLNVETSEMEITPDFDMDCYSLWDVAIDVCQWVHICRDGHSGFYFVVSIPQTSGCGEGSGSGTQWYCLETPTGSGSGGCLCGETPMPSVITLDVSGLGSSGPTDCSAFNGNFTLDQQGEACLWIGLALSTGEGDSGYHWYLSILFGNLTLCLYDPFWGECQVSWGGDGCTLPLDLTRIGSIAGDTVCVEPEQVLTLS